jgi:hypothetical protein
MVIRDQGIINGNDISLMDLWVFFWSFSFSFQREGKHFGFAGLIKGCKSLFHHAAGEIAWCRFHGIIIDL